MEAVTVATSPGSHQVNLAGLLILTHVVAVTAGQLHWRVKDYRLLGFAPAFIGGGHLLRDRVALPHRNFIEPA